jgi:uncharacterized GH25 family protein
MRVPRIGRVGAALLAAVLLGGGPSGAYAHQYWLSAGDYAPQPGEWVEIRACSGVAFRGEAKPWAPDRAVEFSWIGARRTPLARLSLAGDVVWARAPFADSGGAWVTYESNFASIELPAAEFDAYLAEEGLDQPLAARRALPGPATGRERYRRCCKAWLAGSDARRAAKAAGQPLEIVPLSPPGSEPTLRARVLWKGRPLAGALVKSWRQPLDAAGRTRHVIERDSVGVAEAVRSDARGEVTLETREPGEWLVSVEHMEPSSDRRIADWESTWASLTFARREGGTPPRTGR